MKDNKRDEKIDLNETNPADLAEEGRTRRQEEARAKNEETNSQREQVLQPSAVATVHPESPKPTPTDNRGRAVGTPEAAEATGPTAEMQDDK